MERNFIEILDSLSSEQKQPFIDNFVQTILGRPAAPLILATSKTISNDGSLEERIRLAAEIYGIDPDRIDKEEFLLAEQQLAESKIQVMEIIKDHFGRQNGSGQRSKDDELISLGKFLYTTQMDFRISPMEIPDFILSSGRRSIGLEHTRLEAEKDKGFIAEIWKKYLSEAVAKILDSNPGLTGVANLTLDMDYRPFEGKPLRDFKDAAIKINRHSVIKELSDFMAASIAEPLTAKPPYVKAFSYQPSAEAFSLKYNQDYFARNDFMDMVSKGISKKEKRLEAYRKNAGITECWLLLVFGDGSLSSGFKVDEHSLTRPVDSGFDRIFILNSFDQACFEVAKIPPFLKRISKKQFGVLHIKPL